jgi:hypothetical protein
MFFSITIGVSRRALLVLAAVWAVCLTVSLARRVPVLVSDRAVRPDRAMVESGDPGYHAFLARVGGALAFSASATGAEPGLVPAALLFVDDPAREDEFVDYRAACELYPAAVHVAFRPLPRAGRPISLAADDETWAKAHRPGILGMYARPKPESARLRRITEDHRGRLETAPVEEAAVLPPRPVRLLPWLAGLALLLGLGWAVVNTTGVVHAAGGGATASVALSWVAGAGLFGWLLTVLSLAGVPWTARWSGLAGALLALALWRSPRPEASRPPKLGGWDWAGLALVAMASAVAVAEALAPHPAWSNWDAWAIWDFKVKAAVEAMGLPFAFLRNPDYGFTHPEYPFGWPAVQTFLAQCAGGFDTRLLRLLSPVFALCVPPLLAALLLEAGVTQGRWLIAGAVALLPAALTQSGNGYVDWPVAATTTAALLLLLRACRGAGPAWGAALFAGLAGNLKNEAAIFGLGVLAALLVATMGHRVRRRDLGLAVVVWIALVAPWRAIAFQLDLAPRDFAFAPIPALEAAPGRVFLFVQALALETLGPGLGGASFAGGTPVPWSEWWSHLLNSWLVLWFVVAVVLILGWRRLVRPGARELALVLGVQVAAAVLAYVLTIRDPRWLLASSLDRLLLQWVPAVVALSAALMRPAEQIDPQSR